MADRKIRGYSSPQTRRSGSRATPTRATHTCNSKKAGSPPRRGIDDVLGDPLPRDTFDGAAGRQLLGELYFDRVHVRDMVDDDADAAAIRGHDGPPLRIREI
jgi:hypothetical protein